MKFEYPHILESVLTAKLEKDPLPKIWYDTNRQAFWIQDAMNRWFNVGGESLRRELKIAGFKAACDKDEQVSEIDLITSRIMKEQNIVYAAPLAGYPAGFHQVCGQSVLVTRSPRAIVPGGDKKKEFPTLETFLEQLLGDQLDYFLAWVKCAHRALVAETFVPGQALFLAGPPGCGKSLLQNLITEMLGGRSAKPWRYMSAQTPFNADLFMAEHLMLEDEASSTNYQHRRAFASNLKQFINNETHSCHGKGRDAVTLKCFWRITASLNQEAENIGVLPPLDDDIRSKVMIFKCDTPTCLPSAEDPKARQEWRDKLTLELPEFLSFLKSWRIPPRLKKTKSSGRFGVDSYQHSEVVAALSELSPQTRLLALVDALGLVNGDPWQGTSDELEHQLRKLDQDHTCDRLLNFSNAAGSFLGRLRKEQSSRVESRVLHGRTIWTIRPVAKN